MASSSLPLPRRESGSADVIDLRPWDLSSAPPTPTELGAVLSWLDEPSP